MTGPRLIKDVISDIVSVTIAAFLEEMQIGRGVRIRELDMQDLPMPQSGMTGEQLAAYFDLQVKQASNTERARYLAEGEGAA